MLALSEVVAWMACCLDVAFCVRREPWEMACALEKEPGAEGPNHVAEYDAVVVPAVALGVLGPWSKPEERYELCVLTLDGPWINGVAEGLPLRLWRMGAYLS